MTASSFCLPLAASLRLALSYQACTANTTAASRPTLQGGPPHKMELRCLLLLLLSLWAVLDPGGVEGPSARLTNARLNKTVWQLMHPTGPPGWRGRAATPTPCYNTHLAAHACTQLDHPVAGVVLPCPLHPLLQHKNEETCSAPPNPPCTCSAPPSPLRTCSTPPNPSYARHPPTHHMLSTPQHPDGPRSTPLDHDSCLYLPSLPL